MTRINENKDDLIFKTSDLEDENASTIILVKDIADGLEKRYPGWLWALEPDGRNGVINMYALRLSGTWGYVLHINDLQFDPARRAAFKAAGEILARFGVPRGPYRYDDWKNIPKDLNGDCIPDISDKEGKVRRKARDTMVDAAVKSGALGIRAQDRTNPDGSIYRDISIRLGADNV